MKKGRFLFLIGLFTVSSLAKAQDYTFRVMSNRGANEVKSGSTWQPVKTGSTLNASDEIKLSDNAVVGLIHVKGKPLEIKEPGVHKVSELASKIVGGTSVLNKYADFILSTNSDDAKKNRLVATGAVHRGPVPTIYPLLPGNQDAEIFGNQLVVNWETESKGPFTVTILNMFDDAIHKIETTEKHVNIDLSDPKFSGEDALLIDIRSKTTGAKLDDQSRPMVKRLSAVKSEKVKTSYTELSKELDPNSAFSSLFLASFYEQNRLLVDAIAAYERAIALAPDDPTYKAYYLEFLYRNRIKEDPAAKK